MKISVGDIFVSRDRRSLGRQVKIVSRMDPRGRALLFYEVENVATKKRTTVSDRTLRSSKWTKLVAS